MINKNRLIKLAQDLIRINSENPPNENYKIAEFVKQYLDKLDIKVKTYEFKKGIINIAGFIEGRSKRCLIVSPHIDTVPCGTGWKFDPFSAAIKDGKIYGRGATDCKGNAAVLLEAITSMVEDGQRPNCSLALFFATDEETGSCYSLVPLLKKKKISADAALILDSDEFDIIVAQKGLIHFTIKIFGKKAHGAYIERGINAIELSARIISDLKNYSFKTVNHALLNPPTVNIGKIKGGDKVNIVADYCEFEVDLRFLPGMSAESLLNQVRKLVSKHSKEFRIEIQDIQQPYEISPQHELVKGLLASAKRLKIKSQIKGSKGATVITFFQKYNIPAVSTGYGSRGCGHITDEYAKIDNLYKGALVLEDFLRTY